MEKPGFLTNCINLTTAAYMFYSCEALTGAFPHDIFYTDGPLKRYLNLTTIERMFGRCWKIQTPYRDVNDGKDYICREDMFAKCIALTNISGLFYYLVGNSMTAHIYPNMFKNQTNITNASNLFYLCYNFTGDVHQNFLASSLSKLQYVNGMFDCCNMTYVDPRFLNNGTKNSVLRRVGCLFHSNDNLTGTAPAFWDKTMFPNIESSEEGYQHAFNACERLTNYSTIAQQASGGWITNKSH